ncbi:hypothetical protein PFISCL1PPCAC_17908, partial [Pristionchus fissidentatus]
NERDFHIDSQFSTDNELTKTVELNEEQMIEIPDAELEKIGEGGQAVVYSCRLDVFGMNQKVAVKVYGIRCSSAELSMLRRLQHQNIVKFIGQGRLREVPALVLEFCDSSLRAHLSNHPFDKNRFISCS